MNTSASSLQRTIGELAEAKVLQTLARLPAPWRFFSSVEWRTTDQYGEHLGETDVVIFHPNYGLVVIEIKAGQVYVKDGQWYYAAGNPMKSSPLAQARRNRFALIEKLKPLIGEAAIKQLTITDAVCFPDVVWKGTLPIELPHRAFLLDRDRLKDPQIALTQLFMAATPQPMSWAKSQQQAVADLLSPSISLNMSLATQVEQLSTALHQATQQQMAVLKMLSTQPRLLIEGCAGSGKTVLALMLAKAHAAQHKRVLLTCYNKNLAHYLHTQTMDQPLIQVINFHRLVEDIAHLTKTPYPIKTDPEQKRHFFAEGCAELLLEASALLNDQQRFDTIIVDEAADFLEMWWLALESVGRPKFSWYCFYDLHQSIYQSVTDWKPPFAACSMSLDQNLRNTAPIGQFAATRTDRPLPSAFMVENGIEPTVLVSANFEQMAQQLRQLLKQLISHEGVLPEQIVVLSPYRHTNPSSTWAQGLKDVQVNLEMANAQRGAVRVGTIHGFKGLEADVVIVAGLTPQAQQHPEWLYVGATRAKASLFVLELSLS